MSAQSKGRHEVVEWLEGLDHPRLKQTPLPDVDDGTDGKVICFLAGFVTCAAIVLLVKNIGTIKQFFNF